MSAAEFEPIDLHGYRRHLGGTVTQTHGRMQTLTVELGAGRTVAISSDGESMWLHTDDEDVLLDPEDTCLPGLEDLLEEERRA